MKNIGIVLLTLLINLYLCLEVSYAGGKGITINLPQEEFTVFEIEIIELSFTNDHQIEGVSDPVWKKTAKNDPICYTKKSNLVMTAKLKITPTLTSPVVISLKVDGPGSLDAQINGVSISGSEKIVPGIITTGILEDKIYILVLNFNWSFSMDGVKWASIGTTGPHKIYVTMRDPIDGPWNEAQYKFSCEACMNYAGNDNFEVATKVMTKIATTFTWNGNCHVLAGILRNCVKCQGVPATRHWLYHESDGGVGDLECQKTRVIDPIGPAGSQQYIFNFHSFTTVTNGESIKVYDPTTNSTFNGGWSAYEEWLYTEYAECLRDYQRCYAISKPDPSVDTPPQYKWVPNTPARDPIHTSD
jgi:hypothetical protein